MNITLGIDEEIVKKVRRIALEKDTTLTAMVRDYLTSVANSDAVDRKEQIARLEESYARLSRDMGPRTWTREDLYDRKVLRQR